MSDAPQPPKYRIVLYDSKGTMQSGEIKSLEVEAPEKAGFDDLFEKAKKMGGWKG